MKKRLYKIHTYVHKTVYDKTNEIRDTNIPYEFNIYYSEAGIYTFPYFSDSPSDDLIYYIFALKPKTLIMAMADPVHVPPW